MIDQIIADIMTFFGASSVGNVICVLLLILFIGRIFKW